MTKRDMQIDISGPAGFRERISVHADPDEGQEVREQLRAYLAGSGWDRALWREIKATWPRGWGRIGEVRAD